MEISPKDYGLSARIKLEQIDSNTIAIVKRVKSRIIQKDALKLIEISESIRKEKPAIKVSLICNDNICSKSVKLLNEHNIEIQF